jgi:hypothetical protein
MVKQIEFKFVDGNIVSSRIYNIVKMDYQMALEMAYEFIDELEAIEQLLLKEIILR